MNIRTQEWIQQVEETSGQKLEPEIVQAIIQVGKCAIAFETMGHRDAVEGNEPFDTADFVKWGSKHFPDDGETAASLAELMQLCYMDGYESGAA